MDGTLEQLAHLLAAAHRDASIKLDGEPFAGLSFDQAQQVQSLTRQLLGESAPVYKVAIDALGRAVGAPIYGSLVVPSGATMDMPRRGWLGIEVEIAVRLSSIVTPELAEGGIEGLRGAIESFHVGIEIVGSRFADRLTAGANGPLADNMNSAGYILSPSEWTGGTEIDGLPIEVRVDDKIFWQGAAKAPFGKLLDPLIGYARNSPKSEPLEAGMLVTTGSLCGLVELGSAPRHVAATLSGDAAVDFNIRTTPSDREL